MGRTRNGMVRHPCLRVCHGPFPVRSFGGPRTRGEPSMTLLTNQVFCTTAPRTGYSDVEGVPAPELPEGRAQTNAEVALRTLLRDAKLDEDHFGMPSWNPLGDLIPESSRILIKPNCVHHRNHSG